jgi:hypothetical protein
MEGLLLKLNKLICQVIWINEESIVIIFFMYEVEQRGDTI